jgi:hypothetical protein
MVVPQRFGELIRAPVESSLCRAFLRVLRPAL